MATTLPEMTHGAWPMKPADAAHIAVSQYSQSQKLAGGCSLNHGRAEGLQINVAGWLIAQSFRDGAPGRNDEGEVLF